MERIAVVSGASRGIGRAIAYGLAEEGADLVAIARSGEALAELGREVEQLGRRYVGVEADLSTPDGAREAARRAWSWRGRVNVLVNAAGVLVRKPEEEIEISEWDLTFALNVRAPFIVIESLGGLMSAQGDGCIVNVASVAGQVVTRAPAPYQASKAALIQLTRFYAARLAPRVRVNAVGPGYVRTDLSAAWLSVPENQRWVEERTPLGRVAEPDDIVGPVLFLASDRAAYVTGQHLLVDGGWAVG